MSETEQQEPKKRRRWVWPLATIVTLFVGVGIGAAGAETPEPEVRTETVTETETVSDPEDAATIEKLKGQVADLKGERDTLASQVSEYEQAETERVAKAEAEAEAGFGDGTWLVGEDIEPGTYRSEEGSCYWARLSGTSGEFADILANSNGAGVVTIEESDVAFESAMCGQWERVE